ncbi:MAG: hypothetical protein BWX95_01525 [Bacteroidetes bacterium ADurb.Bin141]|nr:MAG: hypothetical protein BWX95_01525 [Bacteroidetes bacterium ADurb.Bin141]
MSLHSPPRTRGPEGRMRTDDIYVVLAFLDCVTIS